MPLLGLANSLSPRVARPTTLAPPRNPWTTEPLADPGVVSVSVMLHHPTFSSYISGAVHWNWGTLLGSEVQPRAPSASAQGGHPRQEGSGVSVQRQREGGGCSAPTSTHPARRPPSGGWCGTWRRWHVWWWWRSCRPGSPWGAGWGPWRHPASGPRECPWR